MWRLFHNIKVKRMREKLLNEIHDCGQKARMEIRANGTSSKETKGVAMALFHKSKEISDTKVSEAVQWMLSLVDSHIANSLGNHKFAIDEKVNADAFDSSEQGNTANKSTAFGSTSTIVWHGRVTDDEVAELGARFQGIGYFGEDWKTWVGLSGADVAGKSARSIGLMVKKKWSIDDWDTIREAYKPMFPSVEELFLYHSFFAMYICDTTWFNRGLLGKRY